MDKTIVLPEWPTLAQSICDKHTNTVFLQVEFTDEEDDAFL